ncbi:ParM/StbA family protein [Clostridium sp.]|uniref:ParM/StbA family protein n=1 Tax=Clostridium sp. TaxID=1506 RepID=UPI003217AC64
MKIAIDLGNRNIKIAYKKGDKIEFDSFQSRFTSEEQQDYSAAEVIELDGVKYSIEQGDYDFEFNKTEKNYFPLLLCAIARATNDEEVEIMLGAPVEHVSGLRNIFKEQLLNTEFEFKYKNEDRKIKITNVGVIGEGFATYFALSRTVRNTKGNIGILDIGGRTVNIATFIQGKQDKVCTLNIGLLDLKNNILKELKRSGKDYDINTVENLLSNELIEIKDSEKELLINKIVNDAKIDKIDISLYTWFVTGGGAMDLGSTQLETVFGSDCILKDSLYTNVLGYYNFMIAKWGE